jgi:8-oxo-dGTP pyrophosphatase MutT (NUDIX family)
MDMKQVSKLIIIDNEGKYLLMYRSEHPAYGIDPDLPGGTVEEGEDPAAGMIREVLEESGIEIPPADVEEIYHGAVYSKHDTDYSLYITKLDHRPEVKMSWEHSSYEWLGKQEFLERAKSANDTYMHMVHDKLS